MPRPAFCYLSIDISLFFGCDSICSAAVRILPRPGKVGLRSAVSKCSLVPAAKLSILRNAMWWSDCLFLLFSMFWLWIFWPLSAFLILWHQMSFLWHQMSFLWHKMPWLHAAIFQSLQDAPGSDEIESSVQTKVQFWSKLGTVEMTALRSSLSQELFHK